MSPQEMEKEIRGWIERFVSQYPQGAERIWRMPLVGFADANSPYARSAEPRAGRGDPPAGISRGGALWHRDGRNAFQAR